MLWIFFLNLCLLWVILLNSSWIYFHPRKLKFFYFFLFFGWYIIFVAVEILQAMAFLAHQHLGLWQCFPECTVLLTNIGRRRSNVRFPVAFPPMFLLVTKLLKKYLRFVNSIFTLIWEMTYYTVQFTQRKETVMYKFWYIKGYFHRAQYLPVGHGRHLVIVHLQHGNIHALHSRHICFNTIQMTDLRI